ncbi:hypothetical protein ACLQ2R_32240 [Streptosporangium sp. DT93]
MQPDPYRRWRLAVFLVVVAVAVLYAAYLGLSLLTYLSSLENR